MVNDIRKYGLFILLICAIQSGFAQDHLFSRIKINANSVYVGQPVEVTVSVYTTTWFTKGVDPGNIKVNDAFTFFFRSVSSSERINGKTYAGVNMIYNVFPYSEDDIIFPSLEINVESPDEGTSKGVSRIIKTEEKRLSVKPVPPNINRDEWLVASNVLVSESWSGSVKQVKVGDVLERTISREVLWSVAELIPPVMWDTVPGVSIYPGRAEVKNNRSKTEISASRKEGVKYLFEKEGEVVIPELVISWWNPNTGRLQKRTLKKEVINVQPNPDLGMLESIRDSLAVALATNEETETGKTNFSLFGLSPKQLFIAFTILLLLIYLTYKLYVPIQISWKEKRRNYLQSELYFFREFEKALKQKDAKLAHQLLYRWIDQIDLKEPTIDYFLENYGSEELLNKFRNAKGNETKLVFEQKLWANARNNFLKGVKKSKDNFEVFWVNP